jgi:hypothetical protein
MDPGSAAALVNSMGLGISLSSLVKKHLPTHKEYLPGFHFGVFPGPVRPIGPGMPPSGNPGSGQRIPDGKSAGKAVDAMLRHT